MKLNNQFHVEQFEATVSQPAVPFPPLNNGMCHATEKQTANIDTTNNDNDNNNNDSYVIAVIAIVAIVSMIIVPLDERRRVRSVSIISIFEFSI